MRLRGFLFGLGGGIIGTVLVVVVLIAIGALDLRPEKTVVQQVTTSPPTSGQHGGHQRPHSRRDLPEGRQERGGDRIHLPGPAVVLRQHRHAAGHRVRLRGRQGRLHPHQRPRGGELRQPGAPDHAGVPAQSVSVVFKGGQGGPHAPRARWSGRMFQRRRPSQDRPVEGARPDADPDRDSAKITVGDPVVAIGNPLGYDFSLSVRHHSAIGRTID